MKRFFFSVIALAALTISCTKSGLVELPQTFETPITFEPYTGKAPTTKATVMDSDALQAALYDATSSPTTKGGFHVSAFTHTGTGETTTADYTKTPYMDEDVWYVAAVADNPETQDKDETTAAYWDYNGVSYWPEGKLDFVAYGLNAKNYMDFGTSKTTFTYTVPELVSSQEDLIVSTPAKGQTNTGAKINLPFKQLLSKVGFSLKTNAATAGVDVIVKKVVLTGNFFEQGTVDMTLTKNYAAANADPDLRPYITETSTATTSSYTLLGMPGDDNAVVDYVNGEDGDFDVCVISASSAATTNQPIYASHVLSRETSGTTVTVGTAVKEGADVNNRYMMIIPTPTATTQTNMKITVVYQLTGDEERTAEAQLANTFKFEAGKGYEFVLKVSTLKVDFSVGVTGWDTGAVEESYTLTPVTPAE